MDLRRPLSVVTPTVDGDVLAVLASAEAALTGREIQRLIGSRSHAGVNNVLHRLVAQGIVTGEPVGRAISYRLNRMHLAAAAVEAIAGIRAELFDRMRTHIAAWRPVPRFAAIYGSTSRGDTTEQSDIDVIVVRPDLRRDDDIWNVQLAAFADAVHSWTGNPVEFLDVDESEVRAALRRKDPLYLEIVSDAVNLCGRRDFLVRKAG
jgi:predicted nucleotidyltransferase